MRVSKERQNARIRVSSIRNQIFDVILGASDDTTDAEINLALLDVLKQRQNEVFLGETKGVE